MLFEDLIAKRKRDDFLQFIEHDLRIIVGVDIVVVLPRLQFLHKCAGLVFSADDGFLEGLDDNRDFMLLMGFLGEDDRIGDVRIKFGRNGRRGRDVRIKFGRNGRRRCRVLVDRYRTIIDSALIIILLMVHSWESFAIRRKYHGTMM